MAVRWRLAVLAILGAGVLATAPGALAADCTRTWDGGAATGSWEDAANWTGDVLPGPADVVCLGSAFEVQHRGGTTSVQAVQGGTVRLRVVSGTLDLTSPTEPSTFTGEITLQAGELRIAGPATAAQVRLAGGTLRVAGALTVTKLEAESGTLTGTGRFAVTPPQYERGLNKTTGGTVIVDVAALDVPSIHVEAGRLDLLSPGWAQLNAGALSGELFVSPGATVRTPGIIASIASGGHLNLIGDATVEAVTGTVPAVPTPLSGALSLAGMQRTAQAVDILSGGGLALGFGSLTLDTAVVRSGGSIYGDGFADLNVSAGLDVHAGAIVRGSLHVVGDVRLAGTLEPGPSYRDPAIEVAGSLVMSSSAVHRVEIAGPDQEDVDRLAVSDNVVLGGTLRVTLPQLPYGFLPAVGTEWVIATFGSSTGDFSDVELSYLYEGPGRPASRALELRRTATELRVVVVAAGAPIVGTPTIRLDRNGGVVTFDVNHNHGGELTGVALEYGLTTAYGTRVQLVWRVTRFGDKGYWAPVAPVPDGTYHGRVLATNAFGQGVSPDVIFAVSPPATAPSTPQTPQPLAPVRAVGSRTFVATRLASGALRVPFAYRLVRPCATPCTARVELRLRSGKQLYAAGLAGDGKVLATRKGVRLKADANALRIDVPKAALRGVRWTPAGRRFQTVKVRLRVVLPQADGGELVTVRDGLLRVLRPRPAAG